LVKKIFKVQIYSTDGKDFLAKTRRAFADYRNKLNQNIEHEINEYKNIRKNRYIFILLFDNISNEFIVMLIKN